MKKAIVIGVSLFALLFCLSSDVKNGTDWEMVWSDEFNYTGLPSTENWSFETRGNSYGWGNGEDQFYTDSNLENARVGGGNLTITALKKDFGGKKYTSARLITKGKFSRTYGRFEARIKVPKGQGIWPAFWLMPERNTFGGWPNSGEIDIMEFFGWRPNQVSSAIHTEAYNHTKGNQRSGIHKSRKLHDDFHIYAVEWFPERLDFYFDDIKIKSMKGTKNSPAKWPFTHPFYIILNCAVGGNWNKQEGGIGNTPFPSEMVVDYVRVYKSTTEAPVVAEETNGDMVFNGKFDKKRKLAGWNFWAQDSKSASMKWDKSALFVKIKKASAEIWQIQTTFPGIKLEKGGVYKFSFDARSSQSRPLHIAVNQNYDPYDGYFRETINLSKQWQTFSKVITSEANDSDSRVEFDCGGSKGDVWIDNVSFIRIK